MVEESEVMAETAKDLTRSKEIAEHVCRMLMAAGSVPEFGTGGVPVAVAARVMGKDPTWVQAGIICGWLPIGRATQDMKQVTSMEQVDRGKRTNYYISPKLFWEMTGYVWRGKEEKIVQHLPELLAVHGIRPGICLSRI